MAFELLFQNEYVYIAVVMVASLLAAYLINFILSNYVHKLFVKTKTDIDDLALKIIKKPLYVIVLLIGAHISLKTLSLLIDYWVILDHIFFVLYVLLITVVSARIITLLVMRWFKVQKKFENTPKLIGKIVTSIIYIVAILIILDHFNVEITPIIAALGIGGIAIGLALQSTLSNFFAGLHLISDRPVDVGDYIELEKGSVAGYVVDIGWRSTRIKTPGNNLIVVPNSKLADSIIVNYDMPGQEISTIVHCGVSYESDLNKVEKVALEVAKNIQETINGAVRGYEPKVRFYEFGDSNVKFKIILRVQKRVDKFLVTDELIKALKSRFDKEGIEISYPVRKIING